MTDLTKEQEAYKRLTEILAQQEGATFGQPLQQDMTAIVAREFFNRPKRKLGLIYEKLEALRHAGWSIERQLRDYNDLKKELEEEIKKLQTLEKSADPSISRYDLIDLYLDEWRELYGNLFGIDDLEEEVDSLCNNFIKTMNKLF